MKEKALFISHWKYLSNEVEEGGVRVCTKEYLNLLQTRFEVVPFGVEYSYSLAYRIKSRLGVNAYDDYKPAKYISEIEKIVGQNNIGYVFFNLSNTASFATELKKRFGSKVKLILCSHGNESGDFLHEVTRFQDRIPYFKGLLSSLTLGRMLLKESVYRQMDIDLVLTVSEVEYSLEHWIGAQKVLLVPRLTTPDFLVWNPISTRIGFIGNLSHWPNLYGIEQTCEEIKRLNLSVKIRLTGSPEEIGRSLAGQYPFVEYLGYLPENELRSEAATWNVFINPVYYCSRGVSTKLGKILNWGLPIITTEIGRRGYLWDKGQLTEVSNAHEMAVEIQRVLTDNDRLLKLKNESETIATNGTTLDKLGGQFANMLSSI